MIIVFIRHEKGGKFSWGRVLSVTGISLGLKKLLTSHIILHQIILKINITELI
jgi:hypothetical protein